MKKLVSWVEIPALDFKRAVKFYNTILKIKLQEVDCGTEKMACFPSGEGAISFASSPKQFLRTIRFQNTLHEKQKNKEISLTELAYNCGYFDQSHMIYDYKLLSGKTPSQYFSECEPYSDYFL